LKICGVCREHKDDSEFHKDKSGKLISKCKKCKADYDKIYVAKNREKRKLQQSKYSSDNKEKIASYSVAWRQKNAEHLKESKAKYRSEHKEEISEKQKLYYEKNKEKVLESCKKWAARNRDKVNASFRKYWLKNKAIYRAYSRERDVAKLNASVAWADKDLVKGFYKLSARLEEWLGGSYHVDHIIPLKHPHVCGLHNEFNLQVLSAKDNLSKSNKFNSDDFTVVQTKERQDMSKCFNIDEQNDSDEFTGHGDVPPPPPKDPKKPVGG
jgi:hypothetical protein